MESKDFLGSGLKFPLQVDPRTGRLAMVSHEEDIQEAVGIIIATRQGERVMRPEFGTTLAQYAFEPVTAGFKESIAYELREQLLLQEPRIIDIDISCQEVDGSLGRLNIDIAYTVRSTNNRYNRVYPFYLTNDELEQ